MIAGTRDPADDDRVSVLRFREDRDAFKDRWTADLRQHHGDGRPRLRHERRRSSSYALCVDLHQTDQPQGAERSQRAGRTRGCLAGPKAKQARRAKKARSGKEGPPGAEGTAASIATAAGILQSGKTETGTWAFTKNSPGQIRVPLSLPIPTKEPLHVGFAQSGEEDPSPHCVGSVAKPTADPGYLCVYSEQHEDPLNALGPVRTSGVVLIYESNSTAAPQVNEGTWAATAP